MIFLIFIDFSYNFIKKHKKILFIDFSNNLIKKHKKITLSQAFLSSSETVRLSLPQYKIESYTEKVSEDISQAFISYSRLGVDLQQIWEINPLARKNVLELSFRQENQAKVINYLFLEIDGSDTIEMPIVIDFETGGLNLNRKFIDFGLFIDKNQVKIEIIFIL